jgi:hypothetical protein
LRTDCGASLRSWSLCNPPRHATSRRSGCAAGSCEDEPRSRPSRLFNPARRKLRLRFCRDGMVSRHHNGAAHDDDLRSMERMSEVRIERFCDWQGNGCARECCGLGQLRSRLPHRWQEDLIVVSATDVLGSRPHHPQPIDKMDVPQVGTIVVHLQRGLSDYIAREWNGFLTPPSGMSVSRRAPGHVGNCRAQIHGEGSRRMS